MGLHIFSLSLYQIQKCLTIQYYRIYLVKNGFRIFSSSFTGLLTWSYDFTLFWYCILNYTDFQVIIPCISGINPTWAWCIILFVHYLLLLNVYISVHKNVTLQLTFLVNTLVLLSEKLTSSNDLGSIPSSLIFWGKKYV